MPTAPRLSARLQKVFIIKLDFFSPFFRLASFALGSSCRTRLEKVSGYRRQSQWKSGTVRWSRGNAVAGWTANPLSPHIRTKSAAATQAPAGRRLSPANDVPTPLG